MTKKHFIALADVIRHHQPEPPELTPIPAYDDGYEAGAYDQHASVIADLADFCAAQNPRFNRQRWVGYIAGTNGPNGGKVVATPKPKVTAEWCPSCAHTTRHENGQCTSEVAA